jgi:hypothetical protein
MNKSSNWTALRNPAFRKLWIATVISGTCVAAHDRAATWMMIADVNRGVACLSVIPALMPVVVCRKR